MHKPFLAWFLALCLAGALTGTSALPAFPSADKHICPPSENGAEVAVRNAGGRPGVVFLSQATRTEHWPSGGSGSWNNPNNKATGSQCFAEGMTKADAYGPEHFGNFLLKLDCKTKTGGAAAIILALPDGHIALGAPRADMETNGEVVFASSLALTGSAARLAAHDQPIPFARPRSDCDSNEERAATRAAIQMGTLQPEGKLCLPTRAQLRSGGEALSQVIAARGFVMRFGGLGTLVLLFATEGHTAGHVERQARLLGAGAHSHESKDSKKWMAFALIGAPGTAAVGRDQEEQLQAIATIHRKNGAPLASCRPRAPRLCCRPCAYPVPPPARLPCLRPRRRDPPGRGGQGEGRRARGGAHPRRRGRVREARRSYERRLLHQGRVGTTRAAPALSPPG